MLELATSSYSVDRHVKNRARGLYHIYIDVDLTAVQRLRTLGQQDTNPCKRAAEALRRMRKSTVRPSVVGFQ